jgi:hypothetical protein
MLTSALSFDFGTISQWRGRGTGAESLAEGLVEPDGGLNVANGSKYSNLGLVSRTSSIHASGSGHGWQQLLGHDPKAVFSQSCVDI